MMKKVTVSWWPINDADQYDVFLYVSGVSQRFEYVATKSHNTATTIEFVNMPDDAKICFGVQPVHIVENIGRALGDMKVVNLDVANGARWFTFNDFEIEIAAQPE